MLLLLIFWSVGELIGYYESTRSRHATEYSGPPS
ncbi:MAG: hypothetical protein ACI9OJ_005891, partial [Myxococcota bacterium]